MTSFSDLLTDVDPDDNFFLHQLDHTSTENESKYISVENFAESCRNSVDSITIINFNIRSFYANSDSLFSLLDNSNWPDIFILLKRGLGMIIVLNWWDTILSIHVELGLDQVVYQYM